MGRRPKLLFSLYDSFIQNEDGRLDAYVVVFEPDRNGNEVENMYFTKDMAGLQLMVKILGKEWHPEGAGSKGVGRNHTHIENITNYKKGK